VNEIFNPERIDGFYATTDNERQKSISSDRATNYGVVRMELIEQIYYDMYMQKVKSNNQDDWRRVILPQREVVHVDQTAPDDRLAVHIRSIQDQSKNTGEEVLHLDALIVATGYTRSTHEELCAPVEHLKPSYAGTAPKISGWKVNRDYSLVLDREKVSSGTNIWLQGCNESTHGISDSLLSVLATRSGEMVESIFGEYLNEVRTGGRGKSGVRSML
jgi:L-ornithine N5-oxygenase